MKKCLASVFIVLGVFAWFRFAVDCFNFTGGESGERPALALKSAPPSSKHDLLEASAKSTFNRRPVHTKGHDFTFLVVFTFVFGYFVNKFLRHSDFKFSHQSVTPLYFLRAPPSIL